MVRRPERTLGEDGVVIGQVSGDGVDPGALDGFFKSQIRQDGRQPLCQHTLSGARRSDEQGVMKACRSDLQRPLCKFLPHDIGHIRLVRRGAWDESQGLCRLQLFDYGYSISSPEVLNKVEEKLGQESNVYIFGRIFLQLILNNFGILSDDEEMYYGYNLRLFRGDLPYKFHNFIMRCLNITKEKRFKSIKELEERYKYLIEEKYNVPNVFPHNTLLL